MFCRNCGVEIPDDSHFCPKCGTKVFAQRQGVISSTKIQKTRCIESGHDGDRHLFRDIVIFVGGLVAAWIGYAMWVGSTVSGYFSLKAREYQAAFGRSTPDLAQWAVGLCGALFNIVGAICLYGAVTSLSRRFGVWRRCNNAMGMIVAVVISVVVFIGFALKTSATGKFGVWDCLIMAAVFCGIWKEKRTTKSDKTQAVQCSSCASSVAVNDSEDNKLFRWCSKKRIVISVMLIIIACYSVFTLLALNSRMDAAENRNLAAFLDRSALRDASRRNLRKTNYALEGYKAKGASAEDTSRVSAVATNLPIVGSIIEDVRGVARMATAEYMTDVLENYARDARISEADIEKAREYSQGDAEKMNEYFANIARARFGDRAVKKGEAHSRMSTGAAANKSGESTSWNDYADETFGGVARADRLGGAGPRTTLDFSKLSDEELEAIATGRESELAYVRTQRSGRDVFLDEEPGYLESGWVQDEGPQHRDLPESGKMAEKKGHKEEDLMHAFTATVSGVLLKIPLVPGQSKATVEEQRIVSKYWDNGSLGIAYPAVIAHAKDGTPLFVFDLFYEEEGSAYGRRENLDKAFAIVKSSYRTGAEMRAGPIVAKTVLDSTTDNVNCKGCFAQVTQYRNDVIIGTSYIFSGAVYVNGRVFIIQAFSVRSDDEAKRMFRKMLALWTEKLIYVNAQ